MNGAGGMTLAAMGVVSRRHQPAVTRLELILGGVVTLKAFSETRHFVDQLFTSRCWRVAERAPISADQTLNAFCMQLLSEHVDRRCSDCGGRQYVYAMNGVRGVCPRCNGRGHETDSGLSRARALGMSRSAYRKTWADRFDYCLHALADDDRLASMLIAQKRG